MKKNFGAFGAGHFSLETLVGGRPGTTIFQNPGGGGGGLGGGSHTRTGPGRPPGTHPQPKTTVPIGQLADAGEDIHQGIRKCAIQPGGGGGGFTCNPSLLSLLQS